MRISFNWLREFVDLPDDPAALGSRLTGVGLTLDAVVEEDGDTILDLDISSNRGDCLSHLGVAREAAAIYGRPVRLPDASVPEESGAPRGIAVSVQDDALCRRYTARVIRGVTIGPSPDWMVRRLASSGIRPVNNVADITNYVLLELGQPLHAFDLDRLGSGEIVVRTAAGGETLRTLDDVDRKLDPSMLVIADGSDPIALAGVIGGRDSEISEGTRNVLVESAWFDPLSVRRTARSLNISTEASYRFERGADIEMAAVASDRATRLILELAGGSIDGYLVDVCPARTPAAVVRLRRQRIAGYLGTAIADEHVTGIFEGLRFGVDSDPAGWRVTVPSYRHDISREEDLLEEVARHWGYDRFPATLPAWSGEGRGLRWQAGERTVRGILRGLGYSETCTLAFSQRDTEAKFAPADEPVVLRNPLSEDEPVLRTSLVPGLLGSLRWNLNRGIRDLRLYEIGKVYPARGEYRQLVLGMTGACWPRGVHNPELEGSFYALKGDVEELLGPFGARAEDGETELPGYYHPGRTMRFGPTAVFGELDRSVSEEFRIRQKVYVAEIRIEELYRAGLRSIAAAPVPKYPRVRRDFSLLVERRVRFRDVVAAVRAAGVPELAGIEPFDRLDRGPFPESCYSLAVALEYQSPERTLTDAEVDEFDRRILTELAAIGARLRG